MILYVTIFFIHAIDNAYSQTVLSRDSEPTNDAESIKMFDQVTQDVIRSNVVVDINKNRTSSGHDMNNVNQVSLNNSDQVNNTGDTLSATPDIKLKINDKEQVQKVTDVNRNITYKDTVNVGENPIKFLEIYKDSINNKTEIVNMTDKIYKKQSRHMLRDPFQDVSIRIVKNRTVVRQMLSNWTKNEASSLKRSHKRPNYCALWPDKLGK